MKEIITGLSNSLTVSTTTEALCMEISKEGTSEVKRYFIEYPPNVLPNHRNLTVRGNRLVELTHLEYDTLSLAIKSFEVSKQEHPYLHAPTYLIAYITLKAPWLKIF